MLPRSLFSWVRRAKRRVHHVTDVETAGAAASNGAAGKTKSGNAPAAANEGAKDGEVLAPGEVPTSPFAAESMRQPEFEI